jgi:hypothetical protein
VKAIHDRYFATAPSSFDELRWRLQYIAEEEIGRRLREAQSAESIAAARMVSSLGSG